MSANRIAELLDLRRENAVLRAYVDKLERQLGESAPPFKWLPVMLIFITLALISLEVYELSR